LNILYILLAILLGYLIGSIPNGFIIARLKGVDVTRVESGRTGGTNVARALGWKYGILVGILDILKGTVAVVLARYLFGAQPDLYAPLAGGFAVIGHNWSVFLGFRGGAGGATAAGALLGLNPLAGAIMVPLFILILFVVRYASVATMSVGLGGLLILALFYFLDVGNTPPYHMLFGVIASAAILWALRPNIQRLRQGTERRITFGKRKSA
jgi:glycerol-3-phosphate acyltransferase PlsY